MASSVQLVYSEKGKELLLFDNFKFAFQRMLSGIAFLKTEGKETVIVESSKARFKYSWEMVLFCGLLYSISPHAYRFLRSSGNLFLPCTSTIQRVCNNYFTGARMEQNEHHFLKYISSRFSTLDDEDKLITIYNAG